MLFPLWMKKKKDVVNCLVIMPILFWLIHFWTSGLRPASVGVAGLERNRRMRKVEPTCFV